MNLKDETLEQLFDRWNAFRKTNPILSERKQFEQMEHIRFDRKNPDTSYQNWYQVLPGYYQRKANLLQELYSRLDGDNNHYMGIMSELRENIPQFSYFLFVRHIKKFILRDPLNIESYGESSEEIPVWLQTFINNGISPRQIKALTQYIAHYAIWELVNLTDGMMAYGDLPDNVLSPVIFEYLNDAGYTGQLLGGVHEILGFPDDIDDYFLSATEE